MHLPAELTWVLLACGVLADRPNHQSLYTDASRGISHVDGSLNDGRVQSGRKFRVSQETREHSVMIPGHTALLETTADVTVRSSDIVVSLLNRARHH